MNTAGKVHYQTSQVRKKWTILISSFSFSVEFYNYTQLIKNLALSDEKTIWLHEDGCFSRTTVFCVNTHTEIETVREKMKACLVNRTPLE